MTLLRRFFRDRERGFTLVELLVVLLVLGVLLAVAAPSVLGHKDKAFDARAKHNLALAWKSAKSLAAQNSGQLPAVSNIVSASQDSEPGLIFTQAADGSATVGQEDRTVVIDSDDTGPSLFVAYVRSGSGTVWCLVSPANGQHSFYAADDCDGNGPVGASSGPPPSMLTPPILTGSPDEVLVGQLVPGDDGQWSGSGLSFTRVFCINASASFPFTIADLLNQQNGCLISPLASYTPGASDVGAYLFYCVVASNGAGSAFGCSDPASIIAPVSPVGYWKLGENSGNVFADSSGYNRPMTRTTGTTTGTHDVAGAVIGDDGAFRFNYSQTAAFSCGGASSPSASAGDRMSSAYNQNGNTQFWPLRNQNPYTIEAWINTANHGGGGRGADTSSNGLNQPAQYIGFIFGTGWHTNAVNDEGSGLYMYYPERKLVFVRDINDATLTATEVHSPALDPNTWYHVVGTYDGTTMRLYINGVLVDSAPSNFAIAHDTMKIGGSVRDCGLSSYGSFFQGAVDEAAVYDQALSAAQIQANYAQALVGGGFVDGRGSTPPTIDPVVLPADSLNCDSSCTPSSWTASLLPWIEEARWWYDKGYRLEARIAAGSITSNRGRIAINTGGTMLEQTFPSGPNVNYGWRNLTPTRPGLSTYKWRISATRDGFWGTFSTTPITVEYRWTQ